MGAQQTVVQSSLVIRLRAGAKGKSYWDAQWRYRLSAEEPWRLKKCRLGFAWQEPDGDGGWRRRRGRCPEGWLDERAANVAAVAAMDEHAHQLENEEEERRAVAEHKVTVRELGVEWLCWLEEVRGAKPSTLNDYGFLLRDPGHAFRRGQRTSAGRIMAAFGDRPAEEVTTAEVSAFLRSLDREGLKPRNVNKHRQVLARELEDRQDADAFRLLFYTGLRLGEVLTLRWEDVDLPDRLLLVRRGLSAGQETLPKGRRHRFVPLPTPAVATLARLANRTDFPAPDDYVLVNRWGRRLDASALRRRYRRGCAAAGLRPVRLHGLRHAAGSLIARTSDAVFVRDFLGHSKLATTDRYLSAKLRPEELRRLDDAFAPTAVESTVSSS